MNQKQTNYQAPVQFVSKAEGIYIQEIGKANATLSHDGSNIYIDGAKNYLTAPIKNIVIIWEISKTESYVIKYQGKKYSIYPLGGSMKSMFRGSSMLKELKRNGAKSRIGYFSLSVIIGAVIFGIIFI